MKQLVIALTACVILQGCTQANSARKTLEGAGYTEIEITGWRPFMADRNDTFATGFRAKGPTGKIVTGAVTGGILKGNTIRTD